MVAKAYISFSTRIEIFVVSVIYLAGIYPPEVWPTSIYFFSSREISEFTSFVISLVGVSVLYVLSMFLWADLFKKGLPGKFASKMAEKVLKNEEKIASGWLSRIGRHVGNFRNMYRDRELGYRPGMTRTLWLLMFGALPGGFTLFAILVCASARYFRGIIPILVGFSVSIYLTTIGGVFAVDKIHGFVDLPLGKLLSVLPFALSASNIVIIFIIAILSFWLHQRYKKNSFIK